MGRPKKEQHELREARYNLRFTEAEDAHVLEQARAAGLSANEYLRRRALGYVVPPPPGFADAALVSELNRIGVNVNQLAVAVHTGREFTTYWREVGDQLTAILETIALAALRTETSDAA